MKNSNYRFWKALNRFQKFAKSAIKIMFTKRWYVGLSFILIAAIITLALADTLKGAAIRFTANIIFLPLFYIFLRYRNYLRAVKFRSQIIKSIRESDEKERIFKEELGIPTGNVYLENDRWYGYFQDKTHHTFVDVWTKTLNPVDRIYTGMIVETISLVKTKTGEFERHCLGYKWLSWEEALKEYRKREKNYDRIEKYPACIVRITLS